RAHHGQPLDHHRFAPVQLDGPGDVTIGEPRLDALRHDEQGIELVGEASHGGLVQVVVVVVGDEHEVDRGQVVQRDAGRGVATHPDETAYATGGVAASG